MLFSSAQFVYLFFPTFLACFYLAHRFAKNQACEWVILIFSFIFYSVYSVKYALLLMCSILFNFLLGKQIGRQTDLSQKLRKRLLSAGIILNLASIAYYKYANFFLENLSHIQGYEYTALSILLPLGISFFTFQQIAYLVDVYKKGDPQYNLRQYAVFVSFFPQLIAGPIVHHKPFLSQIKAKSFQMNRTFLIVGLSIFFIGFFKKVVLADGFGYTADSIFNTIEVDKQLVFLESWIGAMSYGFQIYFDFSGYSDMAIGIAMCIGLQLPLNFNSPYKSLSIIEFWRRWHITLSNFLRDYVYIPLGGNRLGDFRRYQNLMIVMLVGGLWHGANWTFVVWGGLHGFYLMVNHLWKTVAGKKNRSSLFWDVCSWLITMIAVVVAWVFFRAESVNEAIAMIRSMLMLSPDMKIVLPLAIQSSLPGFLQQITTPGLVFSSITIPHYAWSVAISSVILGFIFVSCLPNTVQLFSSFFREKTGFEKYDVIESKLVWKQNVKWGLIMGIIIVMSLVLLSESTEFIYFDF